MRRFLILTGIVAALAVACFAFISCGKDGVAVSVDTIIVGGTQ